LVPAAPKLAEGFFSTMNSAQIFDKPENRLLLVVCARKQIRNM